MDYEEKRYELAKDILLKLIDQDCTGIYIQESIKESINIADEFINELKMTKS